MMNDIYFDSSATMMPKFFAKDYYMLGNPNSVHGRGVQAHMALEKARQKIKDCLGVKGGKVIIGGTASQLVHYMSKKMNYPEYWRLRSPYEHECFADLLEFINITTNEPEELQEMLTKIRKVHRRMPILVNWMLVNNVTGSRFPVEEIGGICHKYNAYYIMDCTAAIGHTKLPDNIEDFCDCILASSHKFHGEVGTGFMWVSDSFAENLLGLNDDSHDEYGLIPGTPNVAGARAMADALEYTIEKYDSGVTKKLYADLVKHLNFELDKAGIPYSYVGKEEDFSNAINAITFPEMNADALVQYLSSKGIYISAGHSACSSDDPNASRVLEAFGLTKDEAEHTVRISFSEDNTLAEIDELVKNIVEFRNMFC